MSTRSPTQIILMFEASLNFGVVKSFDGKMPKPDKQQPNYGWTKPKVDVGEVQRRREEKEFKFHRSAYMPTLLEFLFFTIIIH